MVNKRTVVISGATSGIGLAVAEALINQGDSVIGIGKSLERCSEVEQRLKIHTKGNFVHYLTADLSLQKEIHRVAWEIKSRFGCLHGLVNNAGVVPFHQVVTSEGFDLQWAVNHLASFLLTHLLLPLLAHTPGARVVTVSSGSHSGARLNWDDIQLRKRYWVLKAYRQTKLCNVLFMAEFNRRLRGWMPGVRGFAADPGLVNTDIGSKSNLLFARWAWGIRRMGGISPEESAKGIVFLLRENSLPSPDAVYWKHGKPIAPDAYALDPQTARRLWDLSANMCGFHPTEFGKVI